MVYPVCFSVAIFKYITFQVTTKHFSEICLNLSFSVTVKLPVSSACDVTELGCSWPTAIIIILHSLLPGRGIGVGGDHWKILEQNHSWLFAQGKWPCGITLFPSPGDLGSENYWCRSRFASSLLSPLCQPPICDSISYIPFQLPLDW